MSEEKDQNEILKELVGKIAANSDIGIISPKTAEKLRSKGILPPRSNGITLEEYIDSLKVKASTIEKLLPDAPDISAPSILSLYYEIRKAIILGLNGAAITLSGILVEYMLKFASYKVEMGAFVAYDSDKWDEFENMDLSDAIGRAKRNGLLSKENGKTLQDFRTKCRNPYNHYNIKKITAGLEGPVQVLDINSNDIETVQMKAEDSSIIQAQLKPLVTEVL